MTIPCSANDSLPSIKFKDKYRVQSARLQNWDYSSAGAYFLTVCTKDRECMFGDVVDGKMGLNEFGKFAHKCWEQIEKLHDFIILDEFVIMPNHVHGILFIEHPMSAVETRQWRVSTTVHVSTTDGGTSNIGNVSKFGQLPKKSIASVINHYKGFITKRLRETTDFYASWQSNYYDHIIRNEQELNRIRQYIIENPFRWDTDRNNVENIFM